MPRTSLPPRAASPRRWALCAGLLAAGFVVGGGIGTLLVIGAVFGCSTPSCRSRAARRRRPRTASPGWPARAAQARSAARPRRRQQRPARRRPARELGVQLIPIDSITATTEASKARLFDRGFRPDRSSEGRWKSLWMAQARGLDLPPVAVYRIGEPPRAARRPPPRSGARSTTAATRSRPRRRASAQRISTGAPTGTRGYRSITSDTCMRMQPCDARAADRASPRPCRGCRRR